MIAQGTASEQPAGPSSTAAESGLTALVDAIRISGSAADAIRGLIAGTLIAQDFDSARTAAALTSAQVVTLEGEVFHGQHVIEGGIRAEARGILATKREIKELRERADEQRLAVDRLRDDIASLDVAIAAAESAILAVQGEQHRQEKAIVGFDMQLTAAGDAAERVARKQEQIAVERSSAEDERRAQEARQEEARDSIVRIESEQRAADDLLTRAQRRLFDARESMQAQAHRAAEAKASHATLVERAGALVADVQRLEAASAELESRLTGRRDDLQRNETRRTELGESIVTSEATLDEGLRNFDSLRDSVRQADERSQALRTEFEDQDGHIREARRALEGVRAEAAQLDVARATAESDLAHLASTCADAVQATLDEVAAEVEQLERDGALANPRAVEEAPEATDGDYDAPEAAETEDDVSPDAAADVAPAPADAPPAVAKMLTPDEMVADLRAKVERMGAVNMMAIDQFDDLESRHTFLTAQRKDLVDSIASTNEAIRKIDKTTKERFREAFEVINQNFEGTFATLFGGGRAGLTLLDENDQLESGIDIIAQPPGKRLQSVQLLSGGEKALTAMALMFAIFKYRPSPFCLLDEIDAPLDDANIGRFVEMLQGMQEHTQFILITHNRKTMEIADRLYGVTMEEPGVSKLISVQLN